MALWTRDFIWSWRGVVVRETGAVISFNLALAGDVLNWLTYFFWEQGRSLFQPPAFHVFMTPRPIRPWYLWWGVIRRAGGQYINDPGRADIALHFEDVAQTIPDHLPAGLQTLNGACTDITKSRVAEVFYEVFGYELAVNPQTFTGLMVCKSEGNGTHDGHLVEGPCAPKPGWVFQKAIDNTTRDGTVADLRCPTVNGHITFIYVKERPINRRFDNLNTRCRLAEPAEFFSHAERLRISRFCQKMQLDFGGLDVLRDNQTGRLYIVDVNKTDMGPPLALPLMDKLKSTSRLAASLRQEFGLGKG